MGVPAMGDRGWSLHHPRVSVEELLAAKGTKPIEAVEDLAADTFGSDEELDEFLAFTWSERRRDVV